MAYDEFLSDRIQKILKDKNIAYQGKKMFGGVAFMVNEKMCVGIVKNNLMVRIHPDFQEEALRLEGCKMMDFTKRPMKGFLYIEPIGTDLDNDLEFWIQKALDYNPTAKSTKKK